jgi:hypothetical protein
MEQSQLVLHFVAGLGHPMAGHVDHVHTL